MLSIPLVVLFALLFVAAVIDVRTNRIPNALVLTGALAGLGLSTVFPTIIGATGSLSSLAGLGIGLIIFLPLYVFRTLGAGDVKLMAMVGAFLGPYDVAGAALGTFAAGGVLAVAYVLCKGTVGRLARNVMSMAKGAASSVYTGVGGLTLTPQQSAGKLPYAVAIAGGTAAYVMWKMFRIT